MIGLPLRLLAREVYNRAVERVGAEAVALVTGEEKIKPPNPRFWVSTVEAMPRDLDVAFLAIDEIQLAADFERGHVFTDRMLHRRGREETLVLGAATMRPIVERLLPGASIVSRPRLSQLSFAGEKKITRLPRRSAVVAFSAEEVYAIAELIRRQRGGAAVVLGALSPRTRNAQVALYQSGDVDYLVATDAIGMGLNLDVDHVAFASDRKFDGYQFRKLSPAELAQIAGRAGRATRDGTFGTTGRCPPFETELAQALESHTFEPVKIVQWRNTDLDFSSIGALQATLAAAPTENALTRAPVAEDILVLDHAARDDEVRAMRGPAPTSSGCGRSARFPTIARSRRPPMPSSWSRCTAFSCARARSRPTGSPSQVAQADRTDGDIDTLSNRIAHIRTWTFAANRPDWLADPEHWQDVTRARRGQAVRRAARAADRALRRSPHQRADAAAARECRSRREISKTGEVVVEGHVIGRLDGFVFVADASAGGSEAKALQNAAQKALAGEIATRAARLAEAPDEQFVLAADGTHALDRRRRSASSSPARRCCGRALRVIADEHLTGAPREAVEARLDRWLKSHIEKLLGPLFELAGGGRRHRHRARRRFPAGRGAGRARSPAGRRRGQGAGSAGARELAQIRRALRRLSHLSAASAQAGAARARGRSSGRSRMTGRRAKGSTICCILPAAAAPRSRSIGRSMPALYRVAGYRVCGERAVRVDILERLADLIRPALAWREGAAGAKPPGAVAGGGFTVVNAMTSLTGASGEDFASILRSLGYRMEQRPKPPEPASRCAPAAGESNRRPRRLKQASRSRPASMATLAPQPARAEDASDRCAAVSDDRRLRTDRSTFDAPEPVTRPDSRAE